MNKNELIRKLIKSTIHRAARESAACLLVIPTFVYFLTHARIGSTEYYGDLLILIASGFIAGVVWSFTLSYQLLRNHPATDTAFWFGAFMAQARLLRLVPLWYLAPGCTGLLLAFAPTAPGQFGRFAVNLTIVVVLFSVLTWLNRRAAATIERAAQAIAS